MKKAITMLLALCMMLVLCAMPFSAEEDAGMKAVQTLDDVKASGETYLQLTHANVKEFDLNGSDTPLPSSLANDAWSIGGVTFATDASAFINVDSGASGETAQIPGSITWDISGETQYNVFQCEFGKGAWEHSSGAPVQLSVYAYDKHNQELLIAQSPFVKKGDAAVRVAGLIPDNAVTIKVTCASETGDNGSCSSIVANAVVYTADWAYMPSVSVPNAVMIFDKKEDGHVVYKQINIGSFEVTEDMVFCYDVYLTVESSGVGGCNINVDANGDGSVDPMRDFGYIDEEGNEVGGTTIGLLDQKGIACHPHTDLSIEAYQNWYHREFSLKHYNGTMSSLLFAADAGTADGSVVAAAAAGIVKYKDVCIKDGEGNVVWSWVPTQDALDAATDYHNPDKAEIVMSVELGEGFSYTTCTELQYFIPVASDTEYQPPVIGGDDTTAGSNEDPKDETTAGDDDKVTEKPEDPKGGCGGMIGAGAIVLAMVMVAPVVLKKKN